MDLNNMNDLDRFIEDALKSEPMRAVPAGFHRRVEERVRVAAMASHERHGFQSRVVASMILFAMVALTVVVVPALAFYQGWSFRALPGAMGYLDYMTVFVVQSWAQILLALAAGAGTLTVAVLVWVLIPRFRGKAARQH
ncbi:MAG: hypothetical protein HUU46_15595 [Candidatus Hydrogenedentes bacterium]|nr:hypothetical protein [Candidatus Hydrogenedentota bacterium]